LQEKDGSSLENLNENEEIALLHEAIEKSECIRGKKICQGGGGRVFNRKRKSSSKTVGGYL